MKRKKKKVTEKDLKRSFKILMYMSIFCLISYWILTFLCPFLPFRYVISLGILGLYTLILGIGYEIMIINNKTKG